MSPPKRPPRSIDRPKRPPRLRDLSSPPRKRVRIESPEPEVDGATDAQLIWAAQQAEAEYKRRALLKNRPLVPYSDSESDGEGPAPPVLSPQGSNVSRDSDATSMDDLAAFLDDHYEQEPPGSPPSNIPVVASPTPESPQPSPQPSAAWNADEHFQMHNANHRRSKQFETDVLDYQVDFEPFEVDGYGDTVDKLSRILEGVVERIRADLPDPNASMGRVCITAPKLNHPISTAYGSFSEITAESLAELIASKLNSNESLELLEGFQLNVIATVSPKGGSRKERPGAFINRNVVGVAGWALDKRSIVDPDTKESDTPNLCLAKSIVVAKFVADNFDTLTPEIEDPQQRNKKFDSIRKRNEQRALKLQHDVGIPFGEMCGLPEIQIFQDFLNDYQICVRASSVLGKEIFVGPNQEKQINIFLDSDQQHFYTIKSMTGFLDTDQYCKMCRKGYHRLPHTCGKAECQFCKLKDCENTTEDLGEYKCLDCNIVWKTHGCLTAHKIKLCKMKVYCEICRRIVERNKLDPPEKHDCMLNKCRVCNAMKPSGHTCWIEKPKEPKVKKKGEKMTEADMNASDVHVYELLGEMEYNQGYDDEVAAVIAPGHKYFYGDIEAVCVPRSEPQKPILIGFQDEQGTGHWFCERGCVMDFLTTIIEDKQYHNSTFIFHNLSGYDGSHVQNACNELHLKPRPILRGTRLLNLVLTKQKIRFIDSLLFITMALKDMPKAFGLQDEVGLKGEFPFLLATFENLYDDVDWPELKMFSPDTRRVADKRKLVSWWQGQSEEFAAKNAKYNIFEQMQEYCNQDITILRRSCQVFRQNMMDLFNGEDPFRQITLPSYCNVVYRKHFMPEHSIAALPPQGMGAGRPHSFVSIIWLEHMSKTLGMKIKHARTSADEIKIGTCWVDGYGEKDGVKYAFEFQGCLFHGHQDCLQYPECRDPTAINLVSKRKYVDLAAATEEKKQYLVARGYRYVSIYECEFDALRLSDATLGRRYRRMRASYRRAMTTDKYSVPLNPHDSFSLYPSVNAGCNGEAYPIGEPIIQLHEFMPVEEVFGLVKCIVQPPNRLFFPVLPIQTEKVLFGLCGKCMTDGATGFCQHNEIERRIRGTFVSVELQLALKHGYKVVEVFEIWHWEERSTELFKSFISTAYREKVEASGWPEGVETESQKDAYIAKYKMQQGVELRKDKIEKNPARRTIGKFTVTNLWGFFGKRNNPAKTIYCEDYAHYCKIVMDKTKKVVDSYMVGDGDQASLVLMYEDKDEYNDGKTSKIIATFTTAFARCRLYECLDILKEQVCYMDTDSVIYLTGPGMVDLPTGELMGQLTDEVAKDHGPTAFISAFASCGSKSYTLLIDDSVTGERLETVLKFKGIRPCVKNANVLTAENLTKVATDRATFSADVYGMQRDKRKATVKFNAGTKKIRFTADKRLVTKTFGSYPLGWVATDAENEELLTTQ